MMKPAPAEETAALIEWLQNSVSSQSGYIGSLGSAVLLTWRNQLPGFYERHRGKIHPHMYLAMAAHMISMAWHEEDFQAGKRTTAKLQKLAQLEALENEAKRILLQEYGAPLHLQTERVPE